MYIISVKTVVFRLTKCFSLICFFCTYVIGETPWPGKWLSMVRRLHCTWNVRLPTVSPNAGNLTAYLLCGSRGLSLHSSPHKQGDWSQIIFCLFCLVFSLRQIWHVASRLNCTNGNTYFTFFLGFTICVPHVLPLTLPLKWNRWYNF